jgi:hypothetical protein
VTKGAGARGHAQAWAGMSARRRKRSLMPCRGVSVMWDMDAIGWVGSVSHTYLVSRRASTTVSSSSANLPRPPRPLHLTTQPHKYTYIHTH